jgi:hypothetical protein
MDQKTKKNKIITPETTTPVEPFQLLDKITPLLHFVKLSSLIRELTAMGALQVKNMSPQLSLEILLA